MVVAVTLTVVLMTTVFCSTFVQSSDSGLPFYSLGTTNGIVPALLPTDNDVSSDPIIVTGGFRFGDILHTTAYINENGVISFGREFRFPTPSLFPLELSRDAFIVAPFWTDVDIRSGGEIRYEVHQTNNPQSVELLQEVSSFISSQRGSDFDGTWMLVAQWDHVHQYESLMYFFYDDDVSGFYQDYYYIERDEVIPANNTYQAIVITDGSQSFAVFTYNCGELEWSGNATIGYYAAGQLYDSHPLSGTEEAKNIACLNSPWTNIVYPLTPPEEAGPLPPPADGVVLGTCAAASFEHCCPTQLRFCVGEPPDCFCDQQCYMFGDCCVDIEDVCLNVTDFLFPYGEDVGDSQVPPSDDGSSLPIQLSIPIFGSTETTVFVNANGVISFESPFYQFNPEAFPFDSVPLITPFWDDVNILRYGRIYYRQTDDVPSLGMAHDFIAKGFPAEAETFFPTVLFIATWDRVAEYGVSRFVENTFQVVLATDGVMSFVFFLYGDIQWGTANIGFNTGDNVGFYMVPGALTPLSRSIETSSNVDVTGLYIFRTDLPLIFPHGIRFQQAVYDIDEGSGAVSICAETTYDGQLGAVLILSSQEVTAEGTDYNRIRRDIVFNADNTEVCVSISILDDITVEGTETFSITLTTEEPVFTIATTTVNIVDDDAAVLAFERLVYTLEEFSKTTLVCTRSVGQLERDIPVTIISVDDTANGGSDYNEIVEALTFNAVNTRFCVNISVVNDLADEEVESFSLMLVGDNMTAEATIVILDDDTADFVLENLEYIFQEGVGNASVCAVSTSELGKNINITVSFIDSTAINGSDYIGIPQVLMFGASNTKLCVDIPILDNLANENVESFAVILSGTAETALGSAVDIICGEMSSSNTTTTDLIVLYSAYVTIEDDDTVEVGFEYPVYIVSESSGSVTVCVLTNTPLEGSDVDVTLSTSDVTAEADSDYSRKSQVLSFTPRDLSNCINIGILTSYGTLAAEDAEIFHINITSAEVSLFRQSVTVVILDSHSFFPHEDGEVIVNGTDLEEYHSPPINLSQPFPFLGSSENTVYVNSNGVLSFQQPFTDSVRDFPFVGPPLIAPFWSDVHNTDHGTISTHETNDAALVERVHNHVHAAFPSEEEFIPTLLFITTWEQDGKIFIMERSTFQTVLATDGVRSFVIFIYGDIMWSRKTNAGFNAGDGDGHFEVLEERQSSSDIERGSNFGIPGIYVYRTDLPEVMSMNSCSDGEIRTGSGLGTYPTMGDVEICLNSTWRRVCGDSWEDTDASVACRELGFPSGAASQASIPEGSVVYQLDINCNGLEERLFECFNNSLGPEDSGILLPEMGSAEEASNLPGSGSASGGGDDQNPTESCLSYAAVNCTALTVAFDDVSYSVGEGDGTLNICFSLSQPLTRSVNVTMTTVYTGSAQDGVDYTATTVQLTFLPSTNEQCADIPIVNDETVESNETLLVILTTSDPAVSMDTNYAYITITDDDTILITNAATSSGAPSFPSVIPSATQTPMIPATTDSSTDDVAALASGLSVAIVIALLLLIVGAALLFYYKRRKRVARKVQFEARNWSGENETTFIERALADEENTVNPYTMFLKSRMATLKEKGYLEKLTADMIIPSTNLRLLDCIGQGEFGIVYKAHLVRSKPRTTTGSHCSGMPEVVAVKTLKGFYDQDQIDEMMRESIKMREFDHPNVLSLIGVCIDAGPAPYIVTPFMLNGSLVSYLKKERSNLIVDKDADEDEVCSTRKKLLDMCLQIAKGMEYLATRKFIHRDLASRNCMIDSNFVIKVADFGLSENTYVKNYFRQGSGSVKLPIKWMALDSLTDGVFSEKTDVWSFGVTCWEVFSGGKTPYPGVDPLSLIGMLENGHRMEKPRNAACSDEMYTLMLNCWKQEPEERPTFTDLAATISSTLSYMSDYLDISTFGSINPTYTAVEEEKKHETDHGSSEGGGDNCATSGREN